MKLYATTTSERASKGQGGNEYLDINIYFEDRKLPQLELRLHKQLQPVNNPFWHLEYRKVGHRDWVEIIEFTESETKGKSQKGESIYDRVKKPTGRIA